MLSIDSLALLFRLAALGPDSYLTRSQVASTIGIGATSSTHQAFLPLIERQWVTNSTSRIFLTQRGLAAAKAILSQTQDADALAALDP